MALPVITKISKTGNETGATAADKINNVMDYVSQHDTDIQTSYSVIGTHDNRLVDLELDVSTNKTKITDVEQAIFDMQVTSSVFGVLEGTFTNKQTTNIPVTITGFSVSDMGNFVGVNKTAGTITPAYTGWYRVTMFGVFAHTAENISRSFAIELVEDGTTNKGAAIVNIPRDVGSSSASLNALINLQGGSAYTLQMSSSVVLDFDVENLNFSIERV